MHFIDENSNIPIYRQIFNYFVAEIQAGRYSAGDKLPSIRALCRELHVSKSTVESAYNLLLSEGYAESAQGSGYLVDSADRLPVEKRVQQPAGTRVSRRKIYDFRAGALNDDVFPLSLWRKLTSQALTYTKEINTYSDKQGEYELRKEIVRYLHLSRGIACTPERIVMTNGLQQALETISKLIAPAPGAAAIEEPGFSSVRRVFINNRYTIAPIPVGEDGLDIGALHDSSACVVFTTPSHQMPTGAVLSLEKRKQLLKWADATGGYIIEDDYDHEFRYSIRPVKSLHSIDKNNRVIYIGTFSNVFSPGLRMGYYILPDHLLPMYNEMFEGYSCTIPWLQQKIMTLYMSRGHWVKRINQLFAENKRKQRCLVDNLIKFMGSKIKITGQHSGAHIMLETGELSEAELVERASLNNVIVSPVKAFWHNAENYKNNSVILGYNAIAEKDIRQGVQQLYNAWFKH